MPQVINTNVMSLNAQRNLNQSNNALKTSLERLSSGLRINSAKDDAAGLAIADRMTSQIRGMNQAVRNANDAISMAQTGEGALKQTTANLQRMRELAVQSANVTNTDGDRASLDAEFQELLAENDRLAETTSFNGKKVLDGTLSSAVYQVGANVGETITVNLNSSMRNTDIGNYATTTLSMEAYNQVADGTVTMADTKIANEDNEIVINNTGVSTIADEGDGKSTGSAYLVAKMINQHTDTTGVTATAGPTTQGFASTDIAAASNAGAFQMSETAGAGDTLTYTVAINGTDIVSHGEGDAALSVSELANRINDNSATTGVIATVTSTNGLDLTASDGRNIEITETLGGASEDGDTATGYFGNTLTGASQDQELNAYKGSVELSSPNSISFETDTETNDTLFTGVADNTTYSAEVTSIATANVTTVSNSEAAIQRIDQAISDVDEFRGTFGAVQARFESTISSLETTVENVSSARSRIQDADFAAETAQLTRNQILQQAGTAMLSQANSAPQGVLALLQ